MNEYYGNRNAFHRFLVTGSDDSGTENYHDLEGFDGHKPTKVLHIQPHGFSSVPVKDAHLIGLRMGHHDDMLVALGGEHADHKPKKLGPGNVALYNADGSIMKIIGKDVTLDAQGNATYSVKSMTFKCGGVTVVIDKNGLTITGGAIKHDDKNIGKDHTHLNGGGVGNSGPPA